jgi:hypothetical protein
MTLPTFSPSLRHGCRAVLTSTALSGAALGTLLALGLVADVLAAPPTPGSVAPVQLATVADYADDTRGVFVPEHQQLRSRTVAELARAAQPARPQTAAMQPGSAAYTQTLNKLATGVADTSAALSKIANNPGPLAGGATRMAALDPIEVNASNLGVANQLSDSYEGLQLAQLSPAAGPSANRVPSTNLQRYPSLATGGQALQPMAAEPSVPMALEPGARVGTGTEIAVGQAAPQVALDIQRGIVRLKEERITVRRGLQRMLDQIGGGQWTVVYDLDETNAALPDMEISIYAEEPFVNVLNALLARLQSRSGQPLRVIKYDQTQRLVITDRTTTGGSASSGAPSGPDAVGTIVVSEAVLRESKVSLHYDEIPLVDALENIVNQAGKGQWRLRMYAGMDQVLKPAHIEEPFAVALERILKVFNLRYEVFAGGKLIVVTAGDRFGFRGVE